MIIKVAFKHLSVKEVHALSRDEASECVGATTDLLCNDGHTTIVRKGPSGPFLGCTKYPACGSTRSPWDSRQRTPTPRYDDIIPWSWRHTDILDKHHPNWMGDLDTMWEEP